MTIKFREIKFQVLLTIEGFFLNNYRIVDNKEANLRDEFFVELL